MKRVCAILLILVLGQGIVNAQKAVLDSLLRVLKAHPEQDAQRVRILNQVVRTSFFIDPFEGERRSDEAVALARKIGDPGLLGATLSLKVGAHQAQLTVDDQGPVMDEAIRLLEISGDARELAWGRYRQYENDLWNDRVDSISAFPRASISMFRQVHDTIGEAWAHYLLAMSLIGEDRIRADSLTRHALELMEACSPPDHAMLLSYWGLMRNNDGAVRVALEIQTEAAARAREQGLTFLLAIAWSTIGTIQWTLGDFPAALSSYVESLKHDEAIGCRDGICASENNIGCIYREMGEPGQALPHFQRSYEIAVEMNSPDRIIAGLNDIGLCDLHAGNALVALEKFSTALDRCPEVKGSLGQQGYDYRITESQRNIGLAKAALGDMQGAILAFGSSVATGDAGGLQHDAANSRIKYADVLMAASGAQLAKAGHHRDWANAMATDLYRTAADSAEARGWLPLRRDALKGLATVYELMGDKQGAIDHLKEYLVVKDSLLTADKARAVNNLQIQYETEKKEQQIVLLGKDKEVQAQEIQKQKLVRNGFVGGFALVALFAGVFFVQRNRISKARKRSDELLLNILPEEVAEELKDTGAAQAKHFDTVTILFTDFKGFTEASEKLSPQDLVEELNTCFKAFDHIITAHGIEKIKTIGDAYMCAGGLPDPKSSTPAGVVYAALEMQAFMNTRKKERDAQGLPAFEMRCGIHTGPVVAGIVGVKKFQYDIWGDTVNTASRMESSGAVGKVNISEATYALVKDVREVMDGDNTQHATRQHATVTAFTFTPRGKVQAKGKGEMEMYFVGLSS